MTIQVSIILLFSAVNQISLTLSQPHHHTRSSEQFLRRDQAKFDPFSRKLDLKWMRVPSRMIESNEHRLRGNPEEIISSKREPLSSSGTEQVEHEQEKDAVPNSMTGEGKSEDVIQGIDDHDHLSDLKSLPSEETGEIINSEESRVDDPRTGSSSQDHMLADSTHHGGGGHGGWLDMGAYSGKKGAFGWYADFPVGYG